MEKGAKSDFILHKEGLRYINNVWPCSTYMKNESALYITLHHILSLYSFFILHSLFSSFWSKNISWSIPLVMRNVENVPSTRYKTKCTQDVYCPCEGFFVFLIHPVLSFLSQTRWQVLSLFIEHIVGNCFDKFLKPCFGLQKDFWFSIVTWPCTCHCCSSILEFLLEVKEPEIRCNFKVLY